MAALTAAEISKLKFAVEVYAERFDVHPKTILRAVFDTPNPSDWAPDEQPIAKVAAAFNMRPVVLYNVMKGREHLKDAEQAAKIMGLSVRRFHQKKAVKAAARHGRIVRYALTEIVAAGL